MRASMRVGWWLFEQLGRSLGLQIMDLHGEPVRCVVFARTTADWLDVVGRGPDQFLADRRSEHALMRESGEEARTRIGAGAVRAIPDS